MQEVCRDHRIDARFFLVIVNAFSNDSYTQEKRLRTTDVDRIVDYLEKTHRYYTGVQLPLIERLLDELLQERPTEARDMMLIKRFFLEYKRELLSHLTREDTTTFPYVRQVCRLTSRGAPTPKDRQVLARYSMQAYAQEHSNVDEKLFDLKNILIKYVRSGPSSAVIQEIVFELFRLERDILDHSRIEDTILRPLVQELEARLFPEGGSKVQVKRGALPPVKATAVKGGSGNEELSDREVDVLRLVARGFLSKQIAGRLGISLHTVLSHRKNITRKLQIRTVAGLTVYALLNQIITTHEVR